MHRALRYGLVAVVAVASLSVGANALVEHRPSGQGTTACASAELSVFPDRNEAVGDVAAYADLSDRVGQAIDRARTRSNRTATLAPELLDDLPPGVVINDTRYEVRTRTSGCPVVADLPRWSNPVLLLFMGIYWVFSPLYLPVGAVFAVVVGYHYFDRWLQFG
jgi:hypothetical protein